MHDFAVVVRLEKKASQTRDVCVAKGATQRAARPDPSLRKNRLLGMTTKLHHYRFCGEKRWGKWICARPLIFVQGLA